MGKEKTNVEVLFYQNANSTLGHMGTTKEIFENCTARIDCGFLIITGNITSNSKSEEWVTEMVTKVFNLNSVKLFKEVKTWTTNYPHT